MSQAANGLTKMLQTAFRSSNIDLFDRVLFVQFRQIFDHNFDFKNEVSNIKIISKVLDFDFENYTRF